MFSPFTFCVHVLEQCDFNWHSKLIKTSSKKTDDGLRAQGTSHQNTVIFQVYLSYWRCYWSQNELQAPFSFFSTFERIAKKILLAQIKANLSASDDMSWDDETQTDDSKSDGNREVQEGDDDDNAPLGDGKFFQKISHSKFVDIIWALMWLEFNTNLAGVEQETTLKRLCVWGSLAFRLFKEIKMIKYKLSTPGSTRLPAVSP